MKRIGILGIGGVGGYFGGLLAKKYYNDPNVEIVFIARGAHQDKIKSEGLQLKSVDEEFVIHPKIVSDKRVEIGKLDLLIVSVKSYSLKDAASNYMDCLNQDGIIITLQNAVDQKEQLEHIIPDNIMHLPGCVYIISNLARPGKVVRQKGPEKFIFGSLSGETSKYDWILKILTAADIKAELVPNINDIIWNKYLFISTVATATSHFNKTIGEVVENDTYKGFLSELIKEAIEVALKKGVKVADQFEEKTFKIMEGLNHKAKTSMQLDIEKGLNSEIEGLTNYIILEGKKLNVKTPNYQLAYSNLSS